MRTLRSVHFRLVQMNRATLISVAAMVATLIAVYQLSSPTLSLSNKEIVSEQEYVPFVSIHIMNGCRRTTDCNQNSPWLRRQGASRSSQGEPGVAQSQCACDRAGVKVFNLGLPKGGSTSLHGLLEQMGCRSVHQKAPPNVTRLKRFSAERLYEERIVTRYGAAPHYGAQAGLLMKLAYWEQRPLLYFFEDTVNALAQMDYDYPPRHVYPQLEYYELLQQQYPESKVIRDVNMKSLWTLH